MESGHELDVDDGQGEDAAHKETTTRSGGPGCIDFPGCCNKSPRIEKLRRAETFTSTLLEIRNLKYVARRIDSNHAGRVF